MTQYPAAARDLPVVLQRNAFSPRLVARAADVWRAMQDIVVDESTAVGWPPEKYAQTGTMFVVRSMAVQHSRELKINEPLIGRTWVSRARREILFTRQVRLFGGTGLVATATQEWAYLARDLSPIKPGPELYEAFAIHDGFTSVELPDAPEKLTGPLHVFEFTTWHTWMDPFGHVNHPDYVEFCDEALCQVLASKGLPTQNIVPVAEEVSFKAAIPAGAKVRVETQLKGQLGSTVITAHKVLVDGKICALATLQRQLLADTGTQLLEALRSTDIL